MWRLLCGPTTLNHPEPPLPNTTLWAPAALQECLPCPKAECPDVAASTVASTQVAAVAQPGGGGVQQGTGADPSTEILLPPINLLELLGPRECWPQGSLPAAAHLPPASTRARLQPCPRTPASRRRCRQWADERVGYCIHGLPLHPAAKGQPGGPDRGGAGGAPGGAAAAAAGAGGDRQGVPR